MLKKFFLKQALKSQMKNIPEKDREKIMAIVDKNPNLLIKIAEEAQVKVKAGQDMISAMTEVMKSHEAELKEIKEISK